MALLMTFSAIADVPLRHRQDSLKQAAKVAFLCIASQFVDGRNIPLGDIDR